jgi:NADH-quinone oxidoreductase subunit G
VVLPAATFAEADGTLVNNEGRAQRFFQVFVPNREIEGEIENDIRDDTPRDIPGDIQESWRWMQDILVAGCGNDGQWSSLDDVTAACAAAIPFLAPILCAAPSAAFRMDGQKIPREPHRYSGRTAMHANVNIHEPEQPHDPDTALAFSMEGYPGHPPPSLIPRFWAPGWNSIQALNKFQDEVGGPLSGGDPGERLIEPMPGAGKRVGKKAAYFENIPAGFEPRAGEWLLLPLHHIFGSEELSVFAPGIAELSVQPYLALNPEDASNLGLTAGDEVQLRLKAQVDAQGDVKADSSPNAAATTAETATEIFRLPLRFKPELLHGTAGLPVGLRGMGNLAGAALPAWGELKKVEKGKV